MREAIGGTSIFQIVIVLIIIFTAIMSLTINHAKAYGVKDGVIGIIENSEIYVNPTNPIGLTGDTIDEILSYLKENGYRSSGRCDEGWTGYNRGLGGFYSTTEDNAIICIKANNVGKAYMDDAVERCRGLCNVSGEEFPSMVYYEIALFYQLDLPVLGNALNLNLKGSTKVVVGG